MSGRLPQKGSCARHWRKAASIAGRRHSLGVFDSRFCGATSSNQLCMFVFLCEPLEHEATGEPSHSVEVLDVAWFAEDEVGFFLHVPLVLRNH